jgi:hypothetical protein
MSVAEIVPGTQILLRGRLSNLLTDAGIADAVLQIDTRQGGDWTRVPFSLRQQNGGWFAIAARMTEISARLQLGVATSFRVIATHPDFVTGEATLDLTPAQFSQATGSVDIGGTTVPTAAIAGAPFVLDLQLEPRPVMLAGLVTRDNDAAQPVAGADVTIAGTGGSTVSTDADGRFRFAAVPLALALDVSTTDGTRTSAQIHVVDFARPVNAITLSLITPPSP